MAPATPRRGRDHLAAARRRFTEAAGLPFAEHLPADAVEEAVRAEGVRFRDRLYPPAVTLWVFLSQVLDAVHCCRQAVARFLAWRVGRGLAPCSADAGAYCKARARLPEGLLARLARDAGRRPQDGAPDGWRWRRPHGQGGGRHDRRPGGHAGQPAGLPPAAVAEPGVGFPLVRLVVLFALATGTALDAALGPYRGKRTGESALFRGLHDRLESGDVLLADRYYCSYFELALVGERGCDAVFRMHQRRRVDFRRGRRLGPSDHIVTWAKPARPEWLAPEEYTRMPAGMAVREVRVWIDRPGYRTRSVLVVATTLLDPEALSWRERRRYTAPAGTRNWTCGRSRTRSGWAYCGARPRRWRGRRCGAPAGVQPDPRADGAGGEGGRPVAVAGELRRGGANGGRLRAAGLGGRGHDVGGDRPAVARGTGGTPGQRPARAVRAAAQQKRRPQTYPLLDKPRDHARARLTARRCG